MRFALLSVFKEYVSVMVHVLTTKLWNLTCGSSFDYLNGYLIEVIIGWDLNASIFGSVLWDFGCQRMSFTCMCRNLTGGLLGLIFMSCQSSGEVVHLDGPPPKNPTKNGRGPGEVNADSSTKSVDRLTLRGVKIKGWANSTQPKTHFRQFPGGKQSPRWSSGKMVHKIRRSPDPLVLTTHFPL